MEFTWSHAIKLERECRRSYLEQLIIIPEIDGHATAIINSLTALD